MFNWSLTGTFREPMSYTTGFLVGSSLHKWRTPMCTHFSYKQLLGGSTFDGSGTTHLDNDICLEAMSSWPRIESVELDDQ